MWAEHLASKGIGFVRGMSGYDPGRPDLLMVHGAGGQGAGFLPQLLGLAKQVNVAAIDLPGHGRSQGPGLPSVGHYAGWLGDFLQAGPVRPVLLGHSLGGAVALTLALERPHLVRGLILANTSSSIEVPPSVLEGLAKDAGAAVAAIAREVYSPGADPGLRERTAAMMAQTPADVLLGDFAMLKDYDVGDRLGEVRQPTLVLAGGEDRVTPREKIQFLGRAIPGARLVVIEGAGHMSFVEKHLAFNQAVLEFMSSIMAAPAGRNRGSGPPAARADRQP